MENITSSKNPRFKNALRLHTSRGRKKQNRIIVFGHREITRAMEAGVEFCELVFDSGVEAGAPCDDSIVLNDRSKACVRYHLDPKLFKELSFGKRHEPVIGIANRPDTSLANLWPRIALTSQNESTQNPFVVVLEAIEKPGNIGAIFRSADGAGASAILLANPRTDAFHPNSIRSSVATVFSIPIGVGSNEEVKEALIEHGFAIVVATPEADLDFYSADLNQPVALILGNEAEGLSDQWRGSRDEKAVSTLSSLIPVKLPMSGTGDSLNVSVTASVMMYECRRQRTIS